MLTNLGFECVVRGLRIGKHMGRAAWDQGVYVYLTDNSTILLHYPAEIDTDDKEHFFSSEEIMAQDWTIIL